LLDGKPLPPKTAAFIEVADPVSPIKKDTTDRNRTSPFAFTGNKFEFRAVGSSQNVGVSSTHLNAIAADSIRFISNEVESRTKGGKTAQAAAKEIAIEIFRKHRRIIFEGNGYTQDWVKEAEKRGLQNLSESVAAIETFDSQKNIDLFKSLNIYTEKEIHARKHIYLEFYAKSINIEGLAGYNMVSTQAIPSSLKHQHAVAQVIAQTKAACPKVDVSAQEEHLIQVTTLVNDLIKENNKLNQALKDAEHKHDDLTALARHYRDHVKTALEKVREKSDALEEIVADEHWSIPKYSEILYIK